MKICKNCEKEEIEDETHINFSCNKYDNIRRKAFNDINKVDNVKLQIANNVSLKKVLWKLLIYFDNSWWEPLNLSSKQWKQEEIKHSRNALKKELGILSF